MADEVHCLRCGDRALVDSLPAPGIALCRHCLDGSRVPDASVLDKVAPPEMRRRGIWPHLATGLVTGMLGAIFPVMNDRILSGVAGAIIGLVAFFPLLPLNKRFGYPGLKRRLGSKFGLPPDLDGISLVLRLHEASLLRQAFVLGSSEPGLLLGSDEGLVFLGERGGTLALRLTPALAVRRMSLVTSWPYSPGIQIAGEGRSVSFCPLEPTGGSFQRLLGRVGSA